MINPAHTVARENKPISMDIFVCEAGITSPIFLLSHTNDLVRTAESALAFSDEFSSLITSADINRPLDATEITPLGFISSCATGIDLAVSSWSVADDFPSAVESSRVTVDASPAEDSLHALAHANVDGWLDADCFLTRSTKFVDEIIESTKRTPFDLVFT